VVCVRTPPPDAPCPLEIGVSPPGRPKGEHRSAQRAGGPARGILIVRPSSLGDIVYAMAVIADLAAHAPDLPIDWVAEEAFAPLVRLDPRIRHVIPLGLRRWRRAPLTPATWRDANVFRHALRLEQYVAIVDLQEQVKGAMISRLARGTRHGLDRANIREPIATWLHDVSHRIDRQQHFLDKCRALTAAAMGFRVQGPARWRFVPPAVADAMPSGRYAIAFHATSRHDKLWPENHWRALLAQLATAGITTLLPWGSADEKARSERLSMGAALAVVPPRQSLPQLAALIRNAEVVVGVDTGLTHLAAAMGTATVAVFTNTDPVLAGVARTGPHAIDVGGNGYVAALAEVMAAVGRQLQQTPRC
jgi:heptosyltransferase I